MWQSFTGLDKGQESVDGDKSSQNESGQVQELQELLREEGHNFPE